MATIKYLHKLVPELNLWVNKTLYNNLFNKKLVQCPTHMSEFWRSKDSVVELLFNETADPSGAVYDGGFHFIWKYRTVNVKKLYSLEPTLFKRIQIYYNSTWVYAAKNDTKFNELFNLAESTITSDQDGYEYPYGIKPTSYVNYNSHIVTSGSDQLNYEDPAVVINESESDGYVVYASDENVFGLTEEECQLCEYLYYYRTGQYDLIPEFEDDYYDNLVSPLSKWVYVYLNCYLYNTVNENHLRTLCVESTGSFRCLVEKHLQDRVYEYIQKQNMTLWERVDNVDGVDKRSFTTYTLGCNTYLKKGRIQSNADGIILSNLDKIPNNHTSFEFIYDGMVQKHGVDYVLKNTGNECKPIVKLVFVNKIKYVENQKFQFMFNYVNPKTPFTGVKKIDFE